MIPNFDLAKLNQQLEQWYAMIAHAQTQPLAEEPRRLLEQALEQVRRGQAVFNAEYPKEAAAFQQRLEAVKRTNAETLAKVESLKQQVAEFKMPEPAAPPVLKPIDGQLGFTFRDELLARYVPKADRDQRGPAALRDFSTEYSAEAAAAARQPVPAAPPAGTIPAYAEPDIEQTPPAVIAALLQLAQVTASDVVYNLGCGDGRLLISAASKYKARGVGIDGKRANVETARDNVRKARLQKRVAIEAGAPLEADVAPASVVFLTLGPKRNGEMRSALERQLRADARIVTHQGGLSGWQPDEETVVHDADGLAYRLRLWRIPARSGPSSSITGFSGPDWEG